MRFLVEYDQAGNLANAIPSNGARSWCHLSPSVAQQLLRCDRKNFPTTSSSPGLPASNVVRLLDFIAMLKNSLAGASKRFLYLHVVVALVLYHVSIDFVTVLSSHSSSTFFPKYLQKEDGEGIPSYRFLKTLQNIHIPSNPRNNVKRTGVSFSSSLSH